MALILEIKENSFSFLDAKKKSDGSIDVKSYFDIHFEQDPIEHENDALNQKIIDLLKQHKMKGSKVHVVLNNRLSLSRELLVPKIKKKRMNLIVRNELMSALNLSEDFVVDYITLSERVVDNVSFEQVMGVAVRESVIADVERWLKSMKLKIRSFQTGTSGMLRMVKYANLVESNQPLIICDICDRYARFFLYNDQEFIVMRTVNPDPTKLEESNTRIVNLIRLLSNSLYREHKLSVERVILNGQIGVVENIIASAKKSLDMNCETVDVSYIFKEDIRIDMLQYLNALGACV